MTKVSDPVISAKDLARHFRRKERASGLSAAVKSFFSPNYTEKRAVDSINFNIQRGTCLGLVGANGAGKTTLLKMAAGLLHPSGGDISVLGFKPAQRAPEFLRRIGMVMGQKSQLWIDIPAKDSFDLLAAIYDIPKKTYSDRLSQLSELFSVKDLLGVQVRRLSLGERMKFEIIAALLHQPELLFLDEPTIGLDLIAKDAIRSFVRLYNSQFGTTIILTSHDMEDIQEICQDLMIISSGSLKFHGPIGQFQSESADFKQSMIEAIKQ